MAIIIFLICEWLIDSSCLHIQPRIVVSWFQPCNLCGIFRDETNYGDLKLLSSRVPGCPQGVGIIILMLAILTLHIFLYCWVHLGPGITFIDIHEGLHSLWFEPIPHDARESMINTTLAALPNHM